MGIRLLQYASCPMNGPQKGQERSEQKKNLKKLEKSA